MKSLVFIFTLSFSINAYALKDCSSFFSSENRHNCEGTVTHNDGDTASGEWKDGKSHGQGTVTFSDGLKYVGDWKDGSFHGEGTLTFSDGAKYVGEFKDDKYHGQVTFTHPDDPDSYRGYFINDEPISLICSDMGFSEGTKAFGDCVLKLIDKIN